MNREHEIPEIPQYFRDAVRSLSEAEVRGGISLGEIRPPRNLAPLSHAIGLEVIRGADSLDVLSTGEIPETSTPEPDGAGDAFGRLILLHDPQGEEQWDLPDGPTMRLVAYIQADMDASVASDPLLPEVAWDWLTEELSSSTANYRDLGGTVTTTASVRYGEIGGPPRAFQLELRASWSAVGSDLGDHVQAFAHILAHVAGLPPEGVTPLGSFSHADSRASG